MRDRGRKKEESVEKKWNFSYYDEDLHHGAICVFFTHTAHPVGLRIL